MGDVILNNSNFSSSNDERRDAIIYDQVDKELDNKSLRRMVDFVLWRGTKIDL